jgi:hypothetical protein|tara:strand:- start:2946 stop:3377 length:432 start_codon:yes stop_codon:yes gene_type:complete
MKNLFLSLVLLLTASFSFANNGLDKKSDFNSNIENVNAKSSKENASIVLDVKKTSISENYRLDFNSIEDFKNFDENQINSFLDGNEVPCEVTATVEVSVTVEGSAGVIGGSVTTTVSASVTASCADIAAAVKKLKETLLAAIK